MSRVYTDNEIPDAETLESIEEPIVAARKHLMLRELGMKSEVDEDTAGYYVRHFLNVMSGRREGRVMPCWDTLREVERWGFHYAIKVLFIKHALIILKDHYLSQRKQKGKAAEAAVAGADKGIRVCDLILNREEDKALALVNLAIQEHPIEPLIYMLKALLVGDRRMILGELKVMELFLKYGASRRLDDALQSELDAVLREKEFSKTEVKHLARVFTGLFDYSHTLR